MSIPLCRWTIGSTYIFKEVGSLNSLKHLIQHLRVQLGCVGFGPNHDHCLGWLRTDLSRSNNA